MSTQTPITDEQSIKLLRTIGKSAAKQCQELVSTSGQELVNPLVLEAAKLKDYPRTGGYDWQRARKTNDARQITDLTRLALARFFRVWIPFDPDDSPFMHKETQIRSKNKKRRADIIRRIYDQLYNTEFIFTQCTFANRLDPTSAGMEKKNHTICALRLAGTETLQYRALSAFDGIEVIYQDFSCGGEAALKPGGL